MQNHWKGFQAITYEIKHSIMQDILSDDGFVTLLRFTCRLRRVGLAVLAPVCSSFCWLNRYTSGRSLIFPLGNEWVPSVSDGNCMVSRGHLGAIHFTGPRLCFYTGAASRFHSSRAPSVRGIYQKTHNLPCACISKLGVHTFARLALKLKFNWGV